MSDASLSLLDLLDVLIDGPYVQARSANLLWRGSTNQRVHFLSDAYSDYVTAAETGPAGMEIIVSAEGMTLTGTLHERFVGLLLGMVDTDRTP